MSTLPATHWYQKMQDSVDQLSAGSLASSTFETAFNQHWPRVHAILLRLCQDPDEAQDLSLEVFVRLHADFDRISSQGRIGAWLYRVATNLGLNALRNQLRRERYEAQAGQEAHLVSVPDDPAEAAERSERKIFVQQVLRELKPVYAHLLVLRSLGLSYRELADAAGISIQSVGARLNRAEQEFEKRYRARFGEMG